MCNRYSAARHEQIREMVLKLYGLKLPENWSPSYNIPPTARVPTVRRDGATLQAELLPWGTKSPMGLVMNARGETLTEKPMWKAAVAHRRCVLLADGFFEFETAGRRKQGHYFTIPSQEVFAIAGLWLPANETQPNRCIMVTTKPNPLVAPYHDRMPSILDDDSSRAWLTGQPLSDDRIAELCRPFPEEKMIRWAAPPDANHVGFQEPAAILPFQREPELF